MSLLGEHKDQLGSRRIEAIILLGAPEVIDSRRKVDSN
jgi:hypothetical protein